MATIGYTSTVAVESDRATIWAAVSDSNRLNQLSGGAEVHYDRRAQGEARFLVRTWIGPMPTTYEEMPFEWVEGEYYAIRRVVRRSVIREIRARYDFLDADGEDSGSRVRCTVELDVRPDLLKPVGFLAAKNQVKVLLGAISKLDAEARGRSPHDESAAPDIDASILRSARRELSHALPERLHTLGEQLISYVRESDESSLAKIRPYELAAAWQADRRDALEVCLNGAVSGLLDMSWDMICPSCRTTSSRVPSLAELGEHASCELCDIQFEVDLDRAVEATFQPAAAIREVTEQRYCTGGPSMTPHVVSQQIFDASGRVELTVPDQDGSLRLFIRGGASAPVEVSSDHPVSVTVHADRSSIRRADSNPTSEAPSDGPICVAPGGTLVVLGPELPGAHAKLEHTEWVSLAASAYDVSTIPAFRKFLSKDLLKPDTVLKIGRASLLFTDLRGSTALYSRVGDAAAFRLVQDHFDLLIPIIEGHNGTIVKTIGDAIMAAFTDEASAVRSSVEMQKAFERFIEEHENTDGVGLKLGLYAGPCYAVTANGLLDYFGQSVNTAARIEGQAGSGDIVMPRGLAVRAEESGWLDGAQVVEQFAAQPKGLDAPLEMARVRVAGSGPR